MKDRSSNTSNITSLSFFKCCRLRTLVLGFSLPIPLPAAIECTDTIQCDGDDVCCPNTSQCENPLIIDPSACGKSLFGAHK